MPQSPQSSPPGREYRIDYVRSAAHRVAYADGVYGGMTPQGKLFMSFWNTRLPAPARVVHELLPDGKLGAERRDRRVAPDCDAIREVEVTVLLDLDVAKGLRAWLDERIRALEAARGAGA